MWTRAPMCLVMVLSSGCGWFGAALMQRESRSARTHDVEIVTEPPGAQIYVDAGAGKLEHLGVSPLETSFSYQEETSLSASTLLGWGLGTAIDAGLATWATLRFTNARPEDRTAAGLFFASAMAATLVIDLGMLLVMGSSYTNDVRNVALLAQHPNYENGRATVSVPVQDEAFMRLRPGKPQYFASQLATQKLPKRPLGKMVVLNVRMGRGVSADFSAPVTAMTLQELMRHNADDVLGMADVAAMTELERVKDQLGCDMASCFAEIGSALGANLVLAGDAALVDDTLLLTYRLVDVQGAVVRGRVTHVIDGKAEADEAIVRGVPEAIARLVNDL